MVRQITGITVRETIPDYIVEKADEVVVATITRIIIKFLQAFRS